MSNTPNYEVDYNDERFDKVESEKNQAIANSNAVYDGMINSSDKYFNDLIQETKNYGETQKQVQQEQTDFAIEKIEQQKEQANKDYIKEQSGAYVDWQKQSSKHGVEAEKMASAGLTNTGYSESSQVSMYNTYQNRVATAREVYNRAVLNYDNAIKDAILQNNAALAEIAYNTLTKTLELSLQGFQYKNQLITDKLNKELEIDNIYYNRYQDVLQQINTENAMAEDIRQYNETMKWNTEQAELDRQFEAQQAEIDRKYKTEQAELDRKHEKEMLTAKTAAEKEILKQQHQNDLAKLEKQKQNEIAILNKQLANEKSLASYTASLSSSSGGGSGGGGGGSYGGPYPITATPEVSTAYYQGSSYKDAVSYMKSKGVPSARASAAMTESEWSRRRTAYKSTGQGSAEVKNNSTYKEYIQDYVEYCVTTYGK